MIKIYYASFDEPLDNQQLLYYKKSLPKNICDKLNRFRRWQDAHASLFGKLLLMRGLEHFGIKPNLNELHYTSYDRPYFKSKIDFNISHSAEYVVCAISDSSPVGIDIEKIQPLELEDFKSQWNTSEFTNIQQAEYPFRQFYNYWTRKEAVIKADGMGLNIPLNEINVTTDIVTLRNNTWQLHEIFICDICVCHLASRKTETKFLIDEAQLVDFSMLSL